MAYYALLGLQEGKHIDAIMKDKRFIVERKTKYYSSYSVDGNPTDTKYGIDVAIIYYKNPVTGEKMPFIGELIEYYGRKNPIGREYLYRDIITGKEYNRFGTINIVRNEAIEHYISNDSDGIDAHSVANYLKGMSESDLELYKKQLQGLDDLLFNYYYDSKKKLEECVEKNYGQKHKSSEDDEKYIKEFIKRRDNTNIN